MMLAVFYGDKMVAPSDSYSPSAEKPRFVVGSWRRAGLPLEIVAPAPATIDELCAAHERSFVEDILACRRNNGFGNRSARVAVSLPFTTGAMLSAARFVLQSRGIACAPCSGFHHSGWNDAGAFCTFNGLMVTAAVLRAERRVSRVGILDCDQHYGDGTQNIIDVLDARAWVRHYTAGAHWTHPSQASAFLRELPSIVRSFADCDLILYQAGADPHIDDPLGGWLTTEELRERDEIVFVEAPAPLVWNLAGGYQRDASGGIGPVLEIHLNTAKAWLAGE